MNRIASLTAATALLLTADAASALDPEARQQNAQKPDCAAMKNMDMSKMDMNDPVMKAMHEKCMGPAPEHAHEHGADPQPAQPPQSQPDSKPKPDDHEAH